MTTVDEGESGRKLEGLEVHTYGDVVVVTGVAVETWTGSVMGYVAGARRYIDIWVRRNGGGSVLVDRRR